MNVPFADITRDEKETFIDGESVDVRIRRAVNDVISRKNFILGDYVEKFENEFANYCNIKHCIGVSNGLSALELSLIGLKIKDEVITVTNTFNATVGAIMKSGAHPILIEASEKNYNIDINKIENAITDRTQAIMPVHLYGQTVDMDKLRIIEDACQAHGAFYNEKRAGSFGNAGCFSFYPGKNLGGYGDGGAVITNDDSLAEFLRKTRNYGQTKKYHHDERPDNSRLDTIQAAVLVEKLKVLDKWNIMRAENAEKYRERLKDIEQIVLPTERKKGEHIYHLFVIQAKERDLLGEYLGKNGIQTGLHYPVPIHLQSCFEKLNYKKGDFPASEKLSNEILSLPMFPTMKENEINYVCENIKKFYTL
jgi:dTDP-4-amino-4,6-dideoxygalactose transaminase